MSLPEFTVQAFAAAKARLLLFAGLVSAISVWEATPTRALGTGGRDMNGLVSQPDGHNLVGTPMQHDSYIFSAQFGPNGRRVVTASKDGTARIWDALTGDAIGEPMQSNEAVYAAEFSPDGKRVVTASAWDARVWDAATGKAISERMKHDAAVVSAHFSPNGQWVVSARFRPDGNRVVTASWDTARVWDVASESGKETALAALLARRNHVKPEACVAQRHTEPRQRLLFLFNNSLHLDDRYCCEV